MNFKLCKIFTLFAIALSPNVLAFAELKIPQNWSDVGSLTQEQCENFTQRLLPEKSFPIKLWKVLYKTSSANQETVQASGLIAVPSDLTFTNDYTNVTVYQHGTIADKQKVPSRLSQETLVSTCLFATFNSIYVAPDYVGLGDSPGLHPYLHADTEASAARDLIADTFQAIETSKIQLLITGYSQGGHAAMSLHRNLEQNPDTRLKVVASAPLAGPYDLSGTSFKDIFVRPQPYNSSFFTAYIITAYQDIYGDIFANPSDVFNSETTSLPELFKTQNEKNILAKVPLLPSDMLNPQYYAQVQAKFDSPIRVRLNQNNVYKWSPASPMFLIYSGGDKTVSPENSRTAFKYMSIFGGNVTSFNVGDEFDHKSGFLLSLKKAREYFQGQF